MQASIITKALAAASANNVATSQSLAGAGPLTLNGSTVSGGVATLDSQRRVILTSAGNDAGLTWTVIGTSQGGQQIVDQFAGANGVAQSNLDFLTITSINSNGATASSVTAGTNAVGSSPWKMFDSYIGTPNLSLDYELVSGAQTVNVEYTQEPFLPSPGPGNAAAFAATNPNPTAHSVPGMGDLSAAAQGLVNFPIHAWRLTVLSGTGTGRLTGRQAGLVGG